MSDDEPEIQTVCEPIQQELLKKREPEPEPMDESVERFRPINRQPLSTLLILDDGSRDDGELIRIRDTKLTIGRDEADVKIPFDADMSSRHAELRCQQHQGKYRWHLLDIDSTNGTFLRAYRASLWRDTELTIGSRRYLFQLPGESEPSDPEVLQTRADTAPPRTAVEQYIPRLIEIGVPLEEARTYSIGGTDIWIGSGDDCQIRINQDPCLDAKQARFFQDRKGRWMIEDQRSTNGIWIRVNRFAIERRAEFQLGQQQFVFQTSHC